ncbi:MAG: hypothetical protein ABJZ55_06695 [Fuerstiella sp.]
MKISVNLLFVFWAICFNAGCGSSDPVVSGDDGSGTPIVDGNSNPESAKPKSQDVGRAPTEARRPDERWTDENGVQYLGNVPLDVFFDQPLEVASNATPLGGMPVANMAAIDSNTAPPSTTNMAAEPPADTAVATSASPDDWAQMLPAKNLLDEVNQIRNFMKSSLQSVGTYNGSMLSIPGRAASLAALAEIASKHPEEISWKDDAVYIRNLAKKMTESNLQRGKKDQARLLLLFENIADVLNRSKPAGLEEPNPEDSFSDVAEMRLLMMRMAEAERKMKNEAGTESAFESKKDIVKHEAMIMASLTKVIAREEYGYGDDPEFVGYAQKVIEACETIRDSADIGAFSAYELALSRISTNCQECHSVYKNN